MLVILVTVYSTLFHYIMAWEGREFSWVTGYYWTLTVMSTLGFGDITFESNLVRIFMSYATLGANTILNLLDKSNVLMVSEGLNVIRVQIPHSLVGLNNSQAQIRQKTGCTIIAVRTNGELNFRLDIHSPLPNDAELIMIGTATAEKLFEEKFSRR